MPISFTEFLFSTEIERDPNDIVSKLARRYSKDMNWDIHVNNKEDVIRFVQHDLVRHTMMAIKDILEAELAGQTVGLVEIGEAHSKFIAEVGASRMAINVAWGDYERYIA